MTKGGNSNSSPLPFQWLDKGGGDELRTLRMYYFGAFFNKKSSSFFCVAVGFIFSNPLGRFFAFHDFPFFFLPPICPSARLHAPQDHQPHPFTKLRVRVLHRIRHLLKKLKGICFCHLFPKEPFLMSFCETPPGNVDNAEVSGASFKGIFDDFPIQMPFTETSQCVVPGSNRNSSLGKATPHRWGGGMVVLYNADGRRWDME